MSGKPDIGESLSAYLKAVPKYNFLFTVCQEKKQKKHKKKKFFSYFPQKSVLMRRARTSLAILWK
jgi:hypothetical protein